jgi:hypothetical protein
MARMRRLNGVAILGAGIGLIAVLGAAQLPSALAQSSPGLWEMTGSPDTNVPIRQCVGDLTALAQFEHRRKICKRSVISDNGSATVISYSCGNGEFGQSKLTVVTPRSMRIETQGISDQLPFNYTIQARRIGDCGAVAAH